MLAAAIVILLCTTVTFMMLISQKPTTYLPEEQTQVGSVVFDGPPWV